MRDLNAWLGTVSIAPSEPVVAGSYGSWTLRYRVGRWGIDDTGSIKVAFRMASDWMSPRFDDPKGEGYTEVTTTGDVRLVVRYDPLGGVRPWSRAIVIEVHDGALGEGDEVRIDLGKRDGGSPGMRAQSFTEAAFEFRVLIDAFGTGVYERVPSSPTLAIAPGPAAALVVVAPSDAQPEVPFAVTVRAQDAWGNPAPDYRGTVRFAGADGVPATYRFTAADAGVHRFEGARLRAPGLHQIEVTDDRDVGGLSNPISCVATPPEFRIVWGDTQAQSGATVGTGGVEGFFRYARDVAALDFVVHSGNDFQITREHWDETRRYVTQFHEPGRFVTFLSYEWSGNTPAGGDFNIVYRGDDGPLHRSSHWQLADRSDENTDRYPVSELWRTFRGRDDVIGIPHVGGRRTDLSYWDAEFCPIVEIVSVHGRFEWFAREAIERGYTVGFVGATDDHSGRPGASYATAAGDASVQLPVRGGLAAVYARDVTREAIWEAMRARRCYATTGERMVVRVTADGHWMGEAFDADRPPALRVRAVGSRSLDTVEILRDCEVVYRHPLGTPGRRIRIAWSGARGKGRHHVAFWDGGLTLSEGRIAGVRPWSFDSPANRITAAGSREVRWRSYTAGDEDGVELDLDAPPEATIRFEAAPATFEFRPAELGAEPLVVAAGGLEQRVVVKRVPDEPAPQSVEFDWTDPEAPTGRHAYWVRIVQADGELAWSSPLYVTLRGRSRV